MAITALSITMMLLFAFLLEINKPLGLILFIIMWVISIGALVFYTINLISKPAAPAGFILISGATYVMQFVPFIIFFLASDFFIAGSMKILPISLMFVFTIAYLVAVLAFSYFNKVAVETDAKLKGRVHEIQNEDDYNNADGSFKGSK